MSWDPAELYGSGITLQFCGSSARVARRSQFFTAWPTPNNLVCLPQVVWIPGRRSPQKEWNKFERGLDMAWLRCGNKLIDYRRSLFWTMVEGRRKNLHRSFTNSTLHSLFFVVFLVCVGECWRSLQMFSRDPEWGGIRWLLRPCHAVVLASGMPSGDMSRKPGRLWMLA